MNPCLTPMDKNSPTDTIAGAIEAGNAILIREFPVHPDPLREFLGRLGNLQSDYTSLIAGEDANPSFGFNIVRPKKQSGSFVRTHFRSSDLPPHNARSWAKLRPKFFAMLMVDPGWRDQQTYQNGESFFVDWHRAFALALSRDPRQAEMDFKLLSTEPVQFCADNVREPNNEGPLIYRIENRPPEHEWGIRIKQNLPEVLLAMGRDDLAGAVQRMQAAAHELGRKQVVALERGDLVIIDNNRWAHGRFSFELMRGSVLNPREVWSTTIL